MPRTESALCLLFLGGFTASICAQTSSLQVICASESPVVYAGQSVGLRVWVADRNGQTLPQAPKLTWHVQQGRISEDERTFWSLAGVTLPAPGATVLQTATVDVDAASGTGRCEVQVLGANIPPGSSETETARQRSERLTARSFLLRGISEPAAYGLQSYLVFANPPRDESERERCLKAIEAYLRVLAPAEDFLVQNVRASRINITMLPVTRTVELPGNLDDRGQTRRLAIDILGVYDYPRAKLLLADLGVDASASGPYLVSRETRSGASSQGRLLVDMTGVAPSQVWDWMTWFCWLSAQERSWSEVAVRKLGLNMRNVIAVTGSSPRVMFASITQWIYVLKPQ